MVTTPYNAARSDGRFRTEALTPEFVASVVPPGTLHGDEIVLLVTKPSIWFILITTFRFIVATVLLGILATHLFSSDAMISQEIALAATLIALGRLIWALMVWSSHNYILTDQRIITIKGVLNVTAFQCTLRKIQRTTLYEPLYLRFFALGTIGFATAATNDFDSTWLMVPHPGETHERIVAAIHRVQR